MGAAIEIGADRSIEAALQGAEGTVARPTAAEFRRLAELVKSKLGISFTEKKRELVVSRLKHFLTGQQVATYTQLVDSVESGHGPVTLEDLANILSTNHTYFFREPAHFEFLRSRVLFELEPRLRGPQPMIRIWSAACSSGEEPWSIAIALRQYLGLRIERTSIGILATDISTRVLAAAERGRYSEERLSAMPPNFRRSWFEDNGDGTWDVRENLRSDVVFRQMNLLSKFDFRVQFDVVFCRNVMIYFDEATRTELLRAIYAVIRPGGWLFIGLAESLAATSHSFQHVRPGIFRRQVEG